MTVCYELESKSPKTINIGRKRTLRKKTLKKDGIISQYTHNNNKIKSRCREFEGIANEAAEKRKKEANKKKLSCKKQSILFNVYFKILTFKNKKPSVNIY